MAEAGLSLRVSELQGQSNSRLVQNGGTRLGIDFLIIENDGQDTAHFSPTLGDYFTKIVAIDGISGDSDREDVFSKSGIPLLKR